MAPTGNLFRFFSETEETASAAITQQKLKLSQLLV